MLSIVRLVLPRNIIGILSDNAIKSSTTVRTTARGFFLEPKVQIVTDSLALGTNDFSGTIAKITGISPNYLLGEMGYFLSDMLKL